MRTFSHGPYNPMMYKQLKVAEEWPEPEEMYSILQTVHSEPPPPIYNMRHIHPVRYSGPIPPYDGPYTMEDVKKMYS